MGEDISLQTGRMLVWTSIKIFFGHQTILFLLVYVFTRFSRDRFDIARTKRSTKYWQFGQGIDLTC